MKSVLTMQSSTVSTVFFIVDQLRIINAGLHLKRITSYKYSLTLINITFLAPTNTKNDETTQNYWLHLT